MAWCENPECGKDGLRKADVEFDETTRKVLCHGCMTLVHPGWMPPSEYVNLSDGIPEVVRLSNDPRLEVALQINEADGFKAAFSYGGISLAIHIPNDDYRQLIGG